MKLGASQSLVQAILVELLHVQGIGVVRLERRILDIVDTSPSEMMLASLEPETSPGASSRRRKGEEKR